MELIQCHYENPVFGKNVLFPMRILMHGLCLLCLLAQMNAMTTDGTMNEAPHFSCPSYPCSSKCLKCDRIPPAFQNHPAHMSTSHCLNVFFLKHKNTPLAARNFPGVRWISSRILPGGQAIQGQGFQGDLLGPPKPRNSQQLPPSSKNSVV